MPLSKITAASISDGTVVAADIANGAVTGPKLGLTSINANNIVNATITGAKLAANTITGDVIGQNAVSQNNIVSVSNTSISGNIASSQIAPNQVFYGNVDIGLALTSNNNNTLSVGGDIELQKTVTADGDSLGQVVFWNNTNAGIASGTSFVKDVARIKGVMDGTGNNSGGRLEFYTKADAGSSQKSMDIDGSGRVTTPFQPGIGIILVNQVFSAATAGFYKPTTYTTTYDVGGGFNPTGGPSSSFRYTAPIAGRYFIQWSVMGNDGSARMEVCVLKNGGDFINGDSNTSKYANAVIASIQYLAANDYLDFRINQGDYYSGVNANPYLSIHLIG